MIAQPQQRNTLDTINGYAVDAAVIGASDI